MSLRATVKPASGLSSNQLLAQKVDDPYAPKATES
jgi:hypothetical protein